MQKTFKKAVACLLAVLMLLCSMPFTAFAATQWWVDAGIENAANTVKAEPTYTGWADDGFELPFGTNIDLTLPDYEGVPTHNADFKPIIAVTVSSIGDSTYTSAQNKTAKTQFYSANTTNTYSAVKAAGNILDPTDIKAGQRVAITLEIGGFDVLRIGQFKGTYDTNLLEAGSFNAMTGAWKAITTSSGTPAIGKADTLYPGALATESPSLDPTIGTFYVAAKPSGATEGKASTYLGNRPFGQYGVVVCTLAFQAKSDCDLTTAFQFNNETYFMTYDPTVVGTACNIGIGEGDDIFTNPLIIWPDVQDSSATRNYDVTIKPWQASAGTVTIDGEEVTSSTGVTKKVAENDTVALVATENAGYKFLGWKANDGTTVSTQREINPLVNANITYTPIFAPAPASNEIVLTFVDAFENIVGVYTITKGDTSFVAPAVPARAGYTAIGWSVTDFAALTEDTVVTPKYTKEVTEYTVTVPAGSTIAVGDGAPQSVPSVSVPYNTQVTVYNPSATAWEINGTTVAYGNTYTFYVGADVDLTIKESVISEQVPCVGSVNTTVSPDGSRVSFLATRKIQTAAGCVQVNAGFIYGTTGVTASTELVDVNGTTVKAVYTKTDAEQYSISFTVTPGKIYNGRAFITYKNAADEIHVAYANLQSHSA